ncbi:MAG TPA: single-stranded-DNA-specific exonuclease RecJ, partial [Chthonomonadaceae bacterium]|nr:single-stranded-DNA-specific exonuclease RecJ [Chthonomonadaceae bacterium]
MSRSHQPKRWRILGEDPAVEEALVRELDLHPVVARLLVQRGIATVEDAELFLDPSLDRLHDPFLLPDAEAACQRIKQALAANEKIRIHGDYDSDGVTSAAIWARCLAALGASVDVFVPHRRRDGYDMRVGFVDECRAAGVGLIITTDCGIQRCDEVERARSYGIDVIVTDHHTPNVDGSLPRAVAVVNPHRHDSRYPFRDLAGAGVAFKLCEALTTALGKNRDGFRRGFLELAAIGTITDVMPLVGENRILVRHGLEALRNTRKPGLQALIEVSGVGGRPLTTYDIGFGIGPRLNSASRIDETQYALDLLVTKDVEDAGALARRLNELNAQRKEDMKRAQDEAAEMLAQQDITDARCLVVSSENWSPGIVGLVASRIVQRTNRPCVVIAIGETGIGKGSARSIPGFNVFNAIDACKDLLTEYGGHAMAAGLAIDRDNLPDFTRQMARIAAEQLSAEDCVPTLTPAMEIDP